MKIKPKDPVIVIAGKDKGKTGKVLRVLAQPEQVVVDGVNLNTKHQKNRRLRSRGQIIEREHPIHVSNVALEASGARSRVGYRLENGKKVRFATKTGATL